MKKRLILQLDQKTYGYWFIENARSPYFCLELLPLGLSKYRQDFNVEIDYILSKNIVFLYFNDFCKKKSKIKFDNCFDQAVFDKAYDAYYDKRWEEMPKIEMPIADYEALGYLFKKIKQEKPLYLLFALDDSGPLNKVEIVGKNELSAQELQEMQAGHEQFVLWQKALQLYNYDHEIVDDVWRSPADSVYDVDIAKYVGRSEGFVRHKIYTKLDVIAELQEKLKSSDPVFLIIHWLRIRMVYGVIESDQVFDELLNCFANMDDGYFEMIFREKLQEIADRLSLGQDVILD